MTEESKSIIGDAPVKRGLSESDEAFEGQWHVDSACPERDGGIEPFWLRWHKERMDQDELVAGLRRRDSLAVGVLVDEFGQRLLRSAFLRFAGA